MPNRLADETSPYLLQHRDNPVDWFPWGPEALERAKNEDMPIFLSIGYSACHWCHVMEHESFEDEETAAVMNALFVSIKVDREERPDLDSIYMQAVQSMTGRGGWPMSVFLTPDGRPFYGGTYYPNTARHGMPSFTDVLKAVADSYHNRRGDVVESADRIAGRLAPPAGSPNEMLTESILQLGTQRLGSTFDWTHGGFGGAPKFPQPMTLELLLRAYARDDDDRALQMVEFTLERMARGGIYDQLGGGFHRYSVDAQWLTPHFEKMLYDNALLSRVYLHAFQITKKRLYRLIVEETLDYVLREMTDPAGGFYSAQDADSEGVEGKFFVWTPAEIAAELGVEKAAAFAAYFDVTQAGNFEGKNILNVPEPPARAAESLGMAENDLALLIQRARKRLYQVREGRVHPGRDDKVLTAWNGLMLKSFAEAATVLKRADYLKAATANAAFLLDNLRQDGRVLRTWKDGRAKLPGYLEDYAMLIDGLLAVYEATFEPRWLDEARSLADAMIALFWSESDGSFYDTGSDAEALIVRPRDVFDNAMPCGGSAAADVLLRLASFTGDAEYSRKAINSIRTVARFMQEHPAGFGHWLGALDFYLGKVREVVLVGERGDAGFARMRDVVFSGYRPNKVVAGLDSADAAPFASPLFEARVPLGGSVTAYVCENFACRTPTTDPEELASQLA